MENLPHSESRRRTSENNRPMVMVLIVIAVLAVLAVLLLIGSLVG